jgi:transposase-like protein
MATGKRHSPEQVVRKLMAGDRLLAEGKDTAAVCRELGVSEATYHRWRNQFGGLKAEDAKRLKELERENSTLKRLLADAELEKVALKEALLEFSATAGPAEQVGSAATAGP